MKPSLKSQARTLRRKRIDDIFRHFLGSITRNAAEKIDCAALREVKKFHADFDSFCRAGSWPENTGYLYSTSTSR